MENDEQNVDMEEKYIESYLRQRGSDLYPSMKFKRKVEKILKKSGMLVSNNQAEKQNYIDSLALLMDNQGSSRISREAFTTAGIWHENNLERNNCQLLVSEVP